MLITCFLFYLLNIVSSFDIQNIQKQEKQCRYQIPMLYEFQIKSYEMPLKSYEMPLDDLKMVIQKNLSTQSIPDFFSSNVSFSTIEVSFTYPKSNSRSVYSFDYNATVTNDTFHIEMNYLAKVQLQGGKIYEVTVVVDKVPVNYTKNFSLVDQRYEFLGVLYRFRPDQMNICIKNISSDTDKTEIEKATKNSLFTKVDNIIQPMSKFLNDNAKTQRMSKIFPTSPYIYEFKFNKIQINVQITSAMFSWLSYSKITFKGVLNSTDQKFPEDESHFQNLNQQPSLFINIEFANNLAQYAVKYISDYQAKVISKQSVDTKVFQFRVIDLHYILPNLLFKYPQYYLNEVSFICDLKEISPLTYEKNVERLQTIANWSCNGYILTPFRKILILKFTTSILYKMRIWIDGKLQVYSDELSLVSTHFEKVSNLKVENEELAQNFIVETFSSLKAYMIGTFFRVPNRAKNVQWNTSEWGNGFFIS